MSAPPSQLEQDRLIAQLAATADQSARRVLMRKHPGLYNPIVIDRIYDEIVKLVRVDLQKADRLAQIMRWLADKLDDDYCRAQSLRARGHLLYVTSKHDRALLHYERALKLFERLGREVDIGRTLSGSLHPLIYLGRYSQAYAWAQRARKIFDRQRDRLRLGRLDSNIGNILYRQDRLEEALEFYRRAYEILRRRGQPFDVAAVLSNKAVCLISLNRFEQALTAYKQARAYCERHGMPLLVAEADYNIAYLHYLRGEYTVAIAMYQEARAGCKKNDDRYHVALCDLDQAEMYLELNLIQEGAQLARQAIEGFKELGMNYEGAKALTNMAIATSHIGQTSRALEAFSSARALFALEENRVWPALIDLYRALVLYREGRYAESHRSCMAAFRFFSRSPLAARAALCELLLSRLHLQAGRLRRSHDCCVAALKLLKRAESPNLEYQVHFTLGQAQEAMADNRRAFRSYKRAHALLEDLRTHLTGEKLKIAFLKDKLTVYESLVWMCVEGDRRFRNPKDAFDYIEQAKSRSLADLIAFHAQTLPGPASGRRTSVAQVRKLREEVSWYQHRANLQETSSGVSGAAAVIKLRRRTRERGKQLAEALASLPAGAAEFVSVQSAGTIGLDRIRSAIPVDATLLEYYVARGVIFACLLTRDDLKIYKAAPAARVRDLLRLLQFQISRYRFGHEGPPDEPLRGATEAHLRDLHKELIEPIAQDLKPGHLIVVPHDFLHHLPFHALFDGERFLVDDFTVSYAPSASVYYLCCTKKARFKEQALVMGIPDPLSPQILEEVRAVASTLSDPRVFTGEAATQEKLEEYGPTSRYVHIATHGLFSPHNPMFSSIRLGRSQLRLFDLYKLRFSSELIVLSGCSTGLNVVVGADELLGLVRGLLYAGAQAVLASLWDVNDRSTTRFMKYFYQELQKNRNRAAALQGAMQKLREQYPHPYYWAPFILIGKFTPS